MSTVLANTASADTNITGLLVSWSEGSDEAWRELVPRVYRELRRLSAARLRHERASHTLETTGLLHETYLRLSSQRHTTWKNRAHFYAIASRVMRRILVDYARGRAAQKRGAGRDVELDWGSRTSLGVGASELLGVDDALRDLERYDAELGRIVELRFFGGLTQEETASVLGVSVPTVARRWRLARAWLYRYLDARRTGG